MLAVKTFKGASWLILSRFAGRAIDMVTMLVLARILTPADFGTTALAMSLVAIVDTVLEVPVSQALTRLREIDKTHLDTGFTLGVARSAIVALAVLLVALPFWFFGANEHFLPLVLVLSAAPIARGLFSPGMVEYSRELSFRPMFVAEFTGKLAAFAAAMATVFAGGGFWAIAVNFVVAPAIASAISYVLSPYKPSLSLSRFSHFSSFVGWFTATQVVSALNWQFDRALIGVTADKATLGHYAVASDLSAAPTQSLIGPALQPVMAAFAKINADPPRLSRAFLKAARVAMLLAVPAALGIALTADLLVAILLGPKWTETVPLMQWLALAVLPIPYFQTLCALSMAVDRPSLMARLSIIDLGFRIVLVSLGVFLASAAGAGIARLVLSGIMFAFYLDATYRLIGVGLVEQLKNLWKLLVAAAVMTAAVLLLRERLVPLALQPVLEFVVTAGLAAATYACTLLILGIRLMAGPSRLELVDRW